MKWKEIHTSVKRKTLVDFIHDDSAPVEVVADRLRLSQWCSGFSYSLIPERTADDEWRKKAISTLTLHLFVFVCLLFKSSQTIKHTVSWALTQVWRFSTSSPLMFFCKACPI